MRQRLVKGVPKFSVQERDARWLKVRNLMAEARLDAIFVPPNTGLWDHFQANVRYLTGIGGNCSQAACVFPLIGEVTAITSPDVHRDFWLQRQDWVTDIRPINTGWGYTQMSIDRLRELGLDQGRIGVTGLAGNTRFPEGITPAGILDGLIRALPDAEIVNANLLMEQARFVKSNEELGFLRKAEELVEASVDVLLREARPGVPENVVYARMLADMLERGGEVPTMILWSAGWPQPPSAQYMPSLRPLRSGDLISIEAEARWAGYVAQNTQPVFLGRAPDIYRQLFHRQQEAIERCYEALRPGATVGEISDIVAAMSDERFRCSLIMHGRGLGDDAPINIHKPRDATMRDWQVEADATFIVKPMIQTHDGNKRLYWGDTVVIGERGAGRLGKRVAELIEIL